MNQEGRGIGLLNKLKAYKLQEQGRDTVQANEELGFKGDERDYGVGAAILRDLGITQNAPAHQQPQQAHRPHRLRPRMVDTVPIEIAANPHNEAYLATKRDKMGHDILRKLPNNAPEAA
ncbi:MAG: hypothetical protein WKG07_06600 [Hymenobacter sp.]